MKVGELVNLLQKCPDDAEVLTEGCDCEGDTCYLEVRDGYDCELHKEIQVLIARKDASLRADEEDPHAGQVVYPELRPTTNVPF